MLRPLLVSALVLAAAGGMVASAEAGEGGDGAAASISSNCSGLGWQERRGREALSSLGGNAAGFRVIFLAERAGYYAMTRARSRTIEVYVRSCAEQSRELLQHVLAHELGHAHDRARLDGSSRSAWLNARGIPADTPWYGCHECPDFDTPAGDYAEAYGQWLRGETANRSALAPPPGSEDLARLAADFFTR